MRVVSRANAEHYSWGNGCDGWHFVRNSNLSVISEQMPASASEVLHYHNQAQQFFFVLVGQAVMEVEGNRVELSAGQGIHIAAGTRHQIRNESGEPVQLLVVSQPPSHGDRVMV
jgi:mannose-6-phosphate isomerase-like protein (cupin superfamily)